MKMVKKILVLAVLVLAGLVRAEITLPAEYTQLEWISSSTGDEYIDTGYLIQTGDAIETKIELASAQPVQWTTVFGCRTTCPTINSFTFQPHYGNANQTTPMYKACNVELKGSANLFPTAVPVTLRCQNETASWTSSKGGGILSLANPQTMTAVSTLFIFNQNQSTTATESKADTGSRTLMKLYSFTITAEDDTVRRNYVPCRRKADRALGLYETIEGEFFVNAAGKGAFAGSDEIDLRYSYVQFTSAQHVDSGYVHTPNTTVELIFNSPPPPSIPTSKSYQGLFGSRNASDTDHSMGFFPWSTWYAAGDNAAVYLRDSTVTGVNVGQTFIYDDWVKMVCNADGASWWRINGEGTTMEVTSPAGTRTAGTYNLYINGFLVGTSSGGGMEGIKFREVKISEPSGVVRDILPMRLATGQVGFYDTVTKTMKSQVGIYGGVLHTISDDGSTIRVYEGSDFTPDDLLGYTAVEKLGVLTLDAAAVTAYPNLAIRQGGLSFQNLTASTIEVAGTLKLVGGAQAAMDVTPEGSDMFVVGGTVDFSEASAANPFVFSLVTSGVGGFGVNGEIMLVSSGCTAGDEAKVRIEGAPVTLAVRNGALVAAYDGDDNVPYTAIWTGNGDHLDLTDADNWTCMNFRGEVLESTIPTAATAISVPSGNSNFNWPAGTKLPCRSIVAEPGSFVLEDDCDWTGVTLNDLFFANGISVELNGHSLTLAAGDGESKYPIPVSNSQTTVGQLVVEVPEGVTFSNTKVVLTGLVRLVKTGAGMFVASCYPQEYTGGTHVMAGTFRLFNDDVADSSTYSPAQASHQRVLGQTNTTVTVEAGATYDINGVYDMKLYPIVMRGGTLVSSKKQTKYSWGGLGKLRLEADSRFELAYSTVVSTGYAGEAFELNGHTLTVRIPENQNFYHKDVAVSNGTLVVTGGGWLDVHTNPFDMTTATLDLESPANLNNYPINVSNLITRYTGTLNAGASMINVYGVFKPMSDRFPAVALHEGAMLDLSEREGAWSVESALGNTLLYADATRIVIDIGSRQPAEAEQLVAWRSIPASVAFSVKGEHVTLNDSLSVVQSGIFFNVPPDSRVVVSATWTGAAGDNDITNPANWTCWNARGNSVPNGVPGNVAAVTLNGPVGIDFLDAGAQPWQFFTIGSCSLTRDCDWSGAGIYPDHIAANATIDLRGHKLFVSAPSGTISRALTVTDSTTDASAPGEFHFNVATNSTFTNTGTKFTGNLRLVKEGPGNYAPQVYTQSYSGGTVLAEGSLKLYNDGTADSSNYALGQTKNPYPLGAHNTAVTIQAGTTFDLNGIYDLHKHNIVLDGGTLINSKAQTKTTWGALANVSLTADSFVQVGNSTVFNYGSFNLGGHVLEATIASGKILYFGNNLSFTNGMLRTLSTGVLQVTAAVNARTVDFDIGSPLNLVGSLDVHDYTANCLTDSNAGTAALNVWGTFHPQAVNGTNDFFYGCTMQNGSTIDLSERTGVWTTVSTFTAGAKEVTFAANADITVDLTGRDIVFTDGFMQIIEWTTPAPATTRFSPDADNRARSRRFIKRDDGLYLMRSELAIIFR